MLVLKYLSPAQLLVYCDVNWVSNSRGRIRWIERHGRQRHFAIARQFNRDLIETMILHSAVHVYRNSRC